MRHTIWRRVGRNGGVRPGPGGRVLLEDPAFRKVAEFEVAGEAYEHVEGVFGLCMRTARLRLGDESIELTEFLGATRYRRTHAATDFSFQHLAVIVSDMDKAYAWRQDSSVLFSRSGRALSGDSRVSCGKGRPNWHKAGGGLFLGIDHTAIVVKDTEPSLHFYRDMLSMRIVRESENYGTEQERLNNVFGARLHITSLAGDEGPGVEFLEYLSPGGGRPYPADERANDLIHWQTRFSGIGLEKAAREFHQAKVEFISSGIAAVPNSEPGFRRALMVRDPDAMRCNSWSVE